MGFGCNARVKVSQEKVCQNQKRDNKVPNVIFYFIFFRYLKASSQIIILKISLNTFDIWKILQGKEI